MRSDIAIAQSARMLPIADIGAKLGIPAAQLEPYGHFKAKISLDYLDSLSMQPSGRLGLGTSTRPTPAAEGRTAPCVGLANGLNRIGNQAVVCLREPSLGP